MENVQCDIPSCMGGRNWESSSHMFCIGRSVKNSKVEIYKKVGNIACGAGIRRI